MERKMKSCQYELFGEYCTYRLEELNDLLIQKKEYLIKYQAADPSSISVSIEKIYSDPYQPDPSIQFCMNYSRPETDKEMNERVEQEERNRKYREERDRKEWERLQKQFG